MVAGLECLLLYHFFAVHCGVGFASCLLPVTVYMSVVVSGFDSCWGATF